MFRLSVVTCIFQIVSLLASEWEEAPFMDSPPFGLDSHHTFGFTLRGKAYIMTGNLRVPEFDHCGECATVEKFSDAFYSYSPEEGWKDLGPHPLGTRGYAQGDVMNPGTDEEVLYFGFGQTRYPDPDKTDSFLPTPRWGFDPTTGNYTLINESSTYPRLYDFWKFNGTTWTQLADLPGIGRTHPSVVAVDGKVYAGLGWGELCTQNEYVCAPHSGLADVRGKSGNLNDVYMYDVETDTWEQIADFPYRAHHAFQFGIENNGDYNGGAYFLHGHAGGYLYSKTYRYDTSRKEWMEMATMPDQGRVAGAQFKYKQYGFMLGGEAADEGRGDDDILDGHANVEGIDDYPDEVTKEHHRSMDTCEFWRYDAINDEWARLAPAPGRSRWAPTSFILDDYVYLLQGVVRDGHGDSFTQEWPTQGYRYYLPNMTIYEESEDSEDSVLAHNIAIGVLVTITIAAFY